MSAEKGKEENKEKSSEKRNVLENSDKVEIKDDNGESKFIEKTKDMKRYEEETGKYAVWRGQITEGFKKWKKGEKIYDRDKERISLYVSEDTKEKWLEFIQEKEISTISKLIRESVNYFIDQQSRLIKDDLTKMDLQTISNISHALKEPLTTIKGFSQLLIENYIEELDEEIKTTIQNIFDQSIQLENKIINILDNIKTESSQYDILLIEDDLATIRLLTSYFESKGYSCKGVISGTKGIEELKNALPKLILLDIILPDLSGYDLCKMIKSDKKYKEIPVYLLTAIPGSEVKKKLDEIKADGYILKPFDFSDFEHLFKYLE
ncbi:MAG: Signal transduction response regulator [Promethearchaeota archaeon]|nr:MAG: Signal transduction response regulator [Candidatus Lokiarchaeota archaeon]